MLGQPPVVSAVTTVATAAAAAAVLLVSHAAAVAASIVTCWRTPACQWLLLPLLAVLVALLAATCGKCHVSAFHSSNYAVHSEIPLLSHNVAGPPSGMGFVIGIRNCKNIILHTVLAPSLPNHVSIKFFTCHS